MLLRGKERRSAFTSRSSRIPSDTLLDRRRKHFVTSRVQSSFHEISVIKSPTACALRVEAQQPLLHELNDSFRYGSRRLRSGCIQRVPRRNEDVMDQRQMLHMPRVESHDVAIAETTLQRQNAALREDNEDLRASALWWKALYEEALHRYADLESSPKRRIASRVDARFSMASSSAAHAHRAGATTRPL